MLEDLDKVVSYYESSLVEMPEFSKQYPMV